MARPTKFPQAETKIIKALEMGATRTSAAGAAGIDRTTLWQWMKDNPTFSNDVTRAEASAEQSFSSVLFAAAIPRKVVETTRTQDAEGNITTRTVTRMEFDWRAAESWLKRRRRAE